MWYGIIICKQLTLLTACFHKTGCQRKCKDVSVTAGNLSTTVETIALHLRNNSGSCRHNKVEKYRHLKSLAGNDIVMFIVGLYLIPNVLK